MSPSLSAAPIGSRRPALPPPLAPGLAQPSPDETANDPPIPGRSCHRPRHEAADRHSEIAADRPNHGATDPVGLGDDGFIGNLKPRTVDAHTIMSAGGFPVDIGQ